MTGPADDESLDATDDATDDGPEGQARYDGDDQSARRRWLRPALIAGIVALVGLGVGLGLALSGSSGGPRGPEGVPLQKAADLASADTTTSGAPVDGITCRKGEQDESYHIHTYLQIFVNGQQVRVPAGAGIAAPRSEQQLPGGPFVDTFTGCLYWLHTHAADGIIHVEAPAKQTFRLGQFFDIWGQPLGPDRVGSAAGPVVAFVNGKRFAGNPRDIPLDPQAVIQLDVGSPVVPFKPVKFHVIGLCSTNCSTPPTSG